MSKIASILELRFYIKADQIINRGGVRSWKRICYELVFPDHIMKYLRIMRLLSYCINSSNHFFKIILPYVELRYRKLGMELGYDINPEVFSYGLCIPHWGTIVVGGNNSVGAYAVLHTSTCISHTGKKIGDGLYLSTGAIILGTINLGNHITIAANSCVNSSFSENGITIGGTPAVSKKSSLSWWDRDGEPYITRVKEVEKLKCRMGL